MSRQPAVTIPPPENAAARSTRGELQHARQKRRAETRPAGHTGVGGGGRDAAAFTCRGDMTFRALWCRLQDAALPAAAADAPVTSYRRHSGGNGSQQSHRLDRYCSEFERAETPRGRRRRKKGEKKEKKVRGRERATERREREEKSAEEREGVEV